MKEKKHVLLAMFFILCFLSGNIFTITEAHADETEIVFIANSSVNESTLTQKELQKVFLGRKTSWENKEKISFVLFDHEVAYPIFLQKIGKSSSQYSQYWKRQVFTGKGKEPLKFESFEELIDYIATTEGAITFVMEPVINDNIKTITITD